MGRDTFSQGWLLVIFTLLCSAISSQENLRVDYTMNLNFGNLESPKIYDFDSYVVFNDSTSIFYYRTAKRVSDDPDYPVMKKHYFFDAKYGKSVLDVVELDSLGFYVFYDRSADSIIAREVISEQPYILKEPVLSDEWIYTDSVKIIDGVLCHHAYQDYRGRVYDVWFDPDSDYHIGPWKMLNIPGLVYLAVSRDDAIRFTLTDAMPEIWTKEISPLMDGPVITFEKYWSKYLEQRKAEFEFYKNGVIQEMIKSNIDPHIFYYPIYHNCFELFTTDLSMLEKWATYD